MAALREGREPDPEQSPERGAEIELHLTALIPETYLADVHSRLTLYKRIASATNAGALRELQVEMIDRFGLLPQPTKNLFELSGLRMQAGAIGIRRLNLGGNGGRIEFAEHAAADTEALLRLIHQHPNDYQLSGPQKLMIKNAPDSDPERMELAFELVSKLTPALANLPVQ